MKVFHVFNCIVVAAPNKLRTSQTNKHRNEIVDIVTELGWILFVMSGTLKWFH